MMCGCGRLLLTNDVGDVEGVVVLLAYKIHSRQTKQGERRPQGKNKERRGAR